MNMPILTRPEMLGPALVEATGDSRWRDHTARLIAGGKSNLTFELESEAGLLVLRRPPSGELLPSAHDMRREALVQRALASSAVPVPEIVLLDVGGDVLGVPSYVMKKVNGHVIRGALPPGYADAAPERVAIADSIVDALAALHAIDFTEVGLGSFGRPVGFLSRQIDRWSEQWDRASAREVTAVTQLATLLRANMPENDRAAIVHGDFRLDNCIMSPHRVGVAAVLDWEMSTLGDPMTDVGMLLFYWREAGEPDLSLVPTVTAQPGFPARQYLAERYSAATGVELDELDYYVAFANFKFAVIAEGIAARVAAGAMAGQDFGHLDELVQQCAASGLELLNSKG